MKTLNSLTIPAEVMSGYVAGDFPMDSLLLIKMGGASIDNSKGMPLYVARNGRRSLIYPVGLNGVVDEVIINVLADLFVGDQQDPDYIAFQLHGSPEIHTPDHMGAKKGSMSLGGTSVNYVDIDWLPANTRTVGQSWNTFVKNHYQSMIIGMAVVVVLLFVALAVVIWRGKKSQFDTL